MYEKKMKKMKINIQEILHEHRILSSTEHQFYEISSLINIHSSRNSIMSNYISRRMNISPKMQMSFLLYNTHHQAKKGKQWGENGRSLERGTISSTRCKQRPTTRDGPTSDTFLQNVFPEQVRFTLY